MDPTLRPARLRPGPRHCALILVAGFAFAAPAHPQGCSQCRDAVSQTPAQTQTAYRRAITLMVVAGGTVFAAGVVTLKRFR